MKKSIPAIFLIFLFSASSVCTGAYTPVQTKSGNIPFWIKPGAYVNYTVAGDFVIRWNGTNYYLGMENRSDVNRRYMVWRIVNVEGDIATFKIHLHIHFLNTGNNEPWGGLPPELDKLYYDEVKYVKINVAKRTLADEPGIVHMWMVLQDDVIWNVTMTDGVNVQNFPGAKPFYLSNITNITPRGITIKYNYPVHVSYKKRKFDDNFIMAGTTYNSTSLEYANELRKDLAIYIPNLEGAFGGWTSMFNNPTELGMIYDGKSGLLIVGQWIDDVVIKKLGFVAPIGVVLKDTNIFDLNNGFDWSVIIIPVVILCAGVAGWVILKLKK